MYYFPILMLNNTQGTSLFWLLNGAIAWLPFQLPFQSPIWFAILTHVHIVGPCWKECISNREAQMKEHEERTDGRSGWGRISYVTAAWGETMSGSGLSRNPRPVTSTQFGVFSYNQLSVQNSRIRVRNEILISYSLLLKARVAPCMFLFFTG